MLMKLIYLLIILFFGFLVTIFASSIFGKDSINMTSSYKGHLINVIGEQIRILQEGNGNDVLLIHGCPGSIEDWEPIAASLKKYCRVTRYDRPGHGFSTIHGQKLPLEYNIKLAKALIKKLQLHNLTVIGHSYGGSITLGLSVQGLQQADRFVTISAPAFNLHRIDKIYYLLAIPLLGKGITILAYPFIGKGKVIAGIRNAFYPHQDIITDDFIKTRLKLWSQPKVSVTLSRERVKLNAELKKISSHYKDIKKEFTIIHGNSDRTVNVKDAKMLAKTIPGSKLKIFENQGHYIQITDADEVSKTLLNAMHINNLN